MPAKHDKVTLLPEERDELQRLVSTGKTAAYKRTRAQILLKADQGPEGPAWSDQQISEAFDVGRVTVERTRKALVLDGLPAALQRQKREHPPTPRKLDGSGEAQLIALACSEPPEGHSQWTLQLYADELVALEVVCIDESNKQQVKETRAPLPRQVGKPERYDYEYERNGVSNLFMIFAPLEGWRHVEVTDRRTSVDFAHCLKEIVDVHFPEADQIVLVSDHLNTHKPASLSIPSPFRPC